MRTRRTTHIHREIVRKGFIGVPPKYESEDFNMINNYLPKDIAKIIYDFRTVDVFSEKYKMFEKYLTDNLDVIGINNEERYVIFYYSSKIRRKIKCIYLDKYSGIIYLNRLDNARSNFIEYISDEGIIPL